jgi:hypothetical protein
MVPLGATRFNIWKFYVLPRDHLYTYVLYGSQNKHQLFPNTQITDCFLGAFAKLRKATISFVMSVHLSVRMEQLGSHLTDFHEI